MGMFLKEFPYLLRDCLSVSVERLEFFRQQTLHYVRILLFLFHWEIYFQNHKSWTYKVFEEFFANFMLTQLINE